MSGIYIHIPFCRQACHYCDFHFSTSLKNKAALIESLRREITVRRDYLENEQVETIYFGGGTPSLLSDDEINSLIDQVYRNFSVSGSVEITLEANPDDLSSSYLNVLRNTSVNRLSIGVQSFFDRELRLLNRVHSSSQGIASVKAAQDIGFNAITIDLIYGIPGLTNDQWRKNIRIAVDMGIKHISCYCLTVEKKTALEYYIRTGKISALSDSQGEEQFEIGMEELGAVGYIHYEIANFCKDGFYSKHNKSYWQNQLYLGIGPSAHSFNGKERQWNISNNSMYIKNVQGNENYFTKEILSVSDRYNEYVLTRLRTIWGCDAHYIKCMFGDNYFSYFKSQVVPYLKEGLIRRDKNLFILSQKGKLFADRIASDLFYVM